MLRLVAHLLLGGASAACGFAAVGVALYAGTPAQASAAGLFAGFGFVAGLLCGGLHAVLDGLPVQPEAPMPPEALASLVRATLATATAERAPRAGSAADRRPSPAELASAALAGAAATSMAAAAVDPAGSTTMNTPTPVPRPAAPAPTGPAHAPAQFAQRRFASSEFGA